MTKMHSDSSCNYSWESCTHVEFYKKIKIKDEDTGKYYYLIVDQNGIVRKVVECR